MIVDKLNFIKEIFQISSEELKTLILKHSKIIGYDKDKLLTKINNFNKIGVDRQLLTENPILLSSPPDKIVLRFAIGKYFNISLHDFIKYNLFIINESKLYAKLKYFNQINKNETENIKWLSRSESDFSKHFHISSNALIEKFPLSDTIKEEILIEFQNEKLEKENN